MSLKRSALKRRSPLARVSPKRRAQDAALKAAKAAVRARDVTCVAGLLWPEVKCGGRLEAHHIAASGMYPELLCDEDNMRLLCAEHHRHVHHVDPRWARRLGLLR